MLSLALYGVIMQQEILKVTKPYVSHSSLISGKKNDKIHQASVTFCSIFDSTVDSLSLSSFFLYVYFFVVPHWRRLRQRTKAKFKCLH